MKKMTEGEKEIIGIHMKMATKHMDRAQELCKHPDVYVRSSGYGMASHANCNLCGKMGIKEWEDKEN